MAHKNSNGYKGYRGFSNNNIKGYPISLEQSIVNVDNSIQEPAMNVEGLLNLANFLETSDTSVGFPEVTVIPDVLRNVARFVNERKKMKYAHREFEKKIQFLSDGLDKQYHVAMRRLENETEIKLTQINGNVKQAIENINRYYDTELAKIHASYKLENEQMNLYYKDLENQRKEQARRFNKMMKYATTERKRATKAIKEAEMVCDVLRQRIYDGTATHEEREHYMELLKFRNAGINVVDTLILQLATKIK